MINDDLSTEIRRFYYAGFCGTMCRRDGGMRMCGRYAFVPEEMEPAVLREIGKMNRTERIQPDTGTIRPGDVPPVLIMEAGAPSARAMRWGMPLSGESRLVINARVESVEKKGMFAGLMCRNRCLLPATQYYEWNRSAAHTRMKISSGRGMYMAGLYRRSEETAAGWEFVVLTKPSSGDVSVVHDRMPLILSDRDSRRAWMRDEAAARAILHAPPEVSCLVEADEPEQLDMFALLDMMEI